MSGEIYNGGFKYKYMEYGVGAKCLIKDATIKFTNPDEFNDPFDCLPSYSLNDAEELVKKDKVSFKRAADFLGYSPAERIMKKKEMVAKVKASVDQGDWVKSIRRNVGICSLTPKACNLLMWAHYGDNHRGVVAEFKNQIPNNLDLMQEYLCSFIVKYSKNKPIEELLTSDYDHALLIKGSDWEYEDEIRCLDIDRGAGIYSYRRDLLESIILGVKFDGNRVGEIKDIVDGVNEKYGLNVRLYRAKMVDDSYKIYIPGHPVYGDPAWG